jgi:hypothetical protein
MNMEVELLQFSNKFEIFNPFEAKTFLLHINMWLEIIKAFKFFLDLRSFDIEYVHNMMATMLDACFKALCIVENLVGHGNAI